MGATGDRAVPLLEVKDLSTVFETPGGNLAAVQRVSFSLNSGQTLGGFRDVNPTKFGQVDNYVTAASNFGGQTEVFNGFDISTRCGVVTGGLVAHDLQEAFGTARQRGLPGRGRGP